MRKLPLTIAIVLICGAFAYAGPEALPSSGKEMKQTVAPVPECDFSWTGFYIGGRAGYGWGQADTSFEPLPDASSFGLRPTTKDADPDGFIGGIELGYNFQISSFVLGFETDFSGSGIEGSKQGPLIQPDGTEFPGGIIRTRQDTDWVGTVRGRLGFTPFCRLLLYGTGGLAYGNVNYSATVERNSNYPVSFEETNVGWTAGGGVEFAIARHWTVKVEYLYYDLGDQSATGNPIPANPPFQVHYNWETTAHTVNGGLNFKF